MKSEELKELKTSNANITKSIERKFEGKLEVGKDARIRSKSVIFFLWRKGGERRIKG